jgi:hypothetical protein
MAKSTLEHPLLDDSVDPILPPTGSSRRRQLTSIDVDRRQVLGIILVLVGLAAVLGAWVGVSGTQDTGYQLSYITSGGLGGMGIIAAGVVLLVSAEHQRDRTAIATLAERMSQLEGALADEFEHLYRGLKESRAPVAGERQRAIQ